jgi:hypothetical protein
MFDLDLFQEYVALRLWNGHELCNLHAELLFVEAGGIYSNHWASDDDHSSFRPLPSRAEGHTRFLILQNLRIGSSWRP